MKNIRFLAALLAALTLALSACGGTQGTAADDTTTDKTTSADADDTTPAETNSRSSTETSGHTSS